MRTINSNCRVTVAEIDAIKTLRRTSSAKSSAIAGMNSSVNFGPIGLQNRAIKMRRFRDIIVGARANGKLFDVLVVDSISDEIQ